MGELFTLSRHERRVKKGKLPRVVDTPVKNALLWKRENEAITYYPESTKDELSEKEKRAK